MKILSIILIVIALENIAFIDFKKRDEINKWYVVNDGVMGGISYSELIHKNDMAIFKGNVSLENNGGFASIRRPIQTLNVNKSSKIKLKLYGDNKNYQIRIKDRRNQYYSYVYNIFVTDGWNTHEIDLQKFTPQFRGYKINKSSFDQSTIEEIGLLIGNKKIEDFQLKIKTISITK